MCLSVMASLTVSPKAAKAEVRASMRERLRAVTPAAREQASRAVCAQLERLRFWRQARCLAFYVPLPSEIDVMLLTPGLAQAGKNLLLPRYCADTGTYAMVRLAPAALKPGEAPWSLVPGWYGIPEPGPELPAEADDVLSAPDVAWLVPGLAFDRAGRRLGRGRGYYDRLLAGRRGPKLGVAFDWQLVPAVPAGPADVAMDVVVTDQQVAEATGGS